MNGLLGCEEKRTRVTVPVEVVTGVAVALVVESVLFTSGAMGERNVVVCNVVEEVNLLLLESQTGSDRVNGSIAPTLVEETTVLVELLKVVQVSGAAEPVEVTDFEVRPLIDTLAWKTKWYKARNLRNGSGCRSRHRHRKGNPSSYH